MRELVYLTAARDDLLGILRYVARESGHVPLAEALVERIRARCVRLAELPGTLGRARPELRADLRSAAHEGYVIFFRYRDDRIEIVNVLEGHRDVDGFYRPS